MKSGFIALTVANGKDQIAWVAADEIAVVQSSTSVIKARQATTVLLRNGHSLTVTESAEEILLAVVEMEEPLLPGEEPVNETPTQEGTETEKPKRTARS